MSSRSKLPRALLALAAISLGVALLAACQPRRPGTQAPDTSAALSHCRPFYIVGDSEAANRPFALRAEELCKQFGVRPELFTAGYMTQDLKDFVQQQGEQIDLIMIPPRLLNVYAEAGLIQPVDKWIDESDPWFTDILPVYRDLYMRFGDHYYSFPYDGDCHLLFYRADLLGELRLPVPETWTEYDQVARALSSRQGTGRLYGTAMIKAETKAYQWFSERYASFGGRYFDDRMRPLIDGPLAVQTLTDIVELERDAAPEAAFDWEDLNRAFLSGTLPMVVQFSDTARFSYDPDVWKSKVAGLVSWSLVPGEVEGEPRGGIWYGRVLTIAARSTQPDVAAAVAKYITSAEVSGEMVTRADTINDPFRVSHFEQPVPSKLFPDETTASHLLETVRKALEHPMADLTIPGGWEYTLALDRAVLRSLRGEQDPAESLAQAAREWEEITESYGREAQAAAYRDWAKRVYGERR